MKLRPHETDLLGRWIVVDGKVVGDANTERIEKLTKEYLEKVAGGGWDTLYRDPKDGRYWELIYPESHMHGGGPPRLTYLSHEQVRGKYGDVIR
ncbi:MAG TPA: Imm27 family immunity protein [Pyrinomonadaceae bacterium]|jgi:hypothetical protein